MISAPGGVNPTGLPSAPVGSIPTVYKCCEIRGCNRIEWRFSHRIARPTTCPPRMPPLAIRTLNTRASDHGLDVFNLGVRPNSPITTMFHQAFRVVRDPDKPLTIQRGN